jgi:hypothetical protein
MAQDITYTLIISQNTEFGITSVDATVRAARAAGVDGPFATRLFPTGTDTVDVLAWVSTYHLMAVGMGSLRTTYAGLALEFSLVPTA